MQHRVLLREGIIEIKNDSEPSETTDIEVKLVHGAHKSRALMLVLIVEG
jgi:L-lactate utilization protein LutC